MAEFTPLDDKALSDARARGEKFYASPKAISIKLDKRRQRVVVGLDTGLELSFDPRQISGLKFDSFDDLTGAVVEGVGTSMYFPRVDADLRVAYLIEKLVGLDDRSRLAS